MDERLYESIFKRKSFHVFRNVGSEALTPAELSGITEVYGSLTPLYPDIRTAIRIVPAGQTNCRCGAEYCILLYTEPKDGCLQNIGYLGEQLDLYLVSQGIGTLWFGMGRQKEAVYDGLQFVIMLAIRKVDDASRFREDMYKSRRKKAEEIWEGAQLRGVTDVVRFAPSACNSQPWLVRNDGALSVFRVRKPGKIGIIPPGKVGFFNRIDLGIFLCFLELCLEHSGIAAARELHSDDGTGSGLMLNAVYRIL